jgi:hypothetical protein
MLDSWALSTGQEKQHMEESGRSHLGSYTILC